MGVTSVLYLIVIIIYIPIVDKSVGVIVSADFFVGFYIHFYKRDFVILHCRSPPVNTSFVDSYWLEVFLCLIIKENLVLKLMECL